MENETLGQIVSFLSQNYMPPVILSSGRSIVAISPHLAGRVIATSSEGPDGENPLFTKRDAMVKPNLDLPYDPEGGHRWWIIPEGQRDWSFYFPVGTTDFSIKNLNKVWKVPPSFDKTAFIVKEQEKDFVSLRAYINATNVKGNLFELAVYLHYQLMQPPDNTKDEGFTHVGYIQAITFENIGRNIRNKKYGMIAPWSLNMLKSGENTWIILPVKKGTIDQVVDYKMSGPNKDSEVENSRFLKRDDYGLFKADGRYRGKLGLGEGISKRSIASIDLDNGLLTVMYVPVQVGVPGQVGKYFVDNRWVTKKRFGGNVIDCYNDSGDIAGGGPISMYELEGVAPVITQKPCIENKLRTTVHQFKVKPSNIEILYNILKQMTGVDLTNENFKAT